MKFATLLCFTAAVAGQIAAAHSGTASLRKHRRELLRTLYARQDYPVEQKPPSCQSGYDAPQIDGSCMCGPGRVQSGDLCVTPIVEGSFATFTLKGSQDLAFAVSVTQATNGPASFLDANQCASIAVSLESRGSVGFYLQASPLVTAEGEPTNDCWVLGNSASDSAIFFAPTLTGIPFTPSTSVAKRAVTQSGSIGAAGGILGLSGSVAPNGGCNPDFDTQNVDGTCTCGTGRVNSDSSNTGCRFTPSAGASRMKRDAVFKNTPW